MLNLANDLANMHELPGLQPFTMTDEVKKVISTASEWDVSSFAHLEGPDKIQGMILSNFPTGDEPFVHWAEFCASYDNAQVEHIGHE